MKQNRIYSGNDYAVCVVDVKECELEDNVFYGQGDKIISVDDKSNCTKMSNQILPKPACQTSE